VAAAETKMTSCAPFGSSSGKSKAEQSRAISIFYLASVSKGHMLTPSLALGASAAFQLGHQAVAACHN
jgi:hypothetical protein